MEGIKPPKERNEGKESKLISREAIIQVEKGIFDDALEKIGPYIRERARIIATALMVGTSIVCGHNAENEIDSSVKINIGETLVKPDEETEMFIKTLTSSTELSLYESYKEKEQRRPDTVKLSRLYLIKKFLEEHNLEGIEINKPVFVAVNLELIKLAEINKAYYYYAQKLGAYNERERPKGIPSKSEILSIYKEPPVGVLSHEAQATLIERESLRVSEIIEKLLDKDPEYILDFVHKIQKSAYYVLEKYFEERGTLGPKDQSPAGVLGQEESEAIMFRLHGYNQIFPYTSSVFMDLRLLELKAEEKIENRNKNTNN